MAKSNPVDETRIADPVEQARRQRRSNAKKAGGTTKAGAETATPQEAVAVALVGKQTEQRTCLDLLSRPEGASIEELQKATGWRGHSVRGFLAGAVKKKLGLTLISEKPDAGPAAIASRPRPECHGPG